MIRRVPEQSGRPAKLPWSLNDLTRLTWFLIISGVVIVGCAAGAGQTSVYDHQLLWIVGAAVALMLSGLGWTRWLLIGSRNLRMRQRRLASITARLGAASPSATGVAEVLLVAGPGMKRYHRVDCALVKDMPVRQASRDAHVRDGRWPCGVCSP